jgi:hypothetical protein
MMKDPHEMKLFLCVESLMNQFEFGEDNDGQIIIYTNCREGDNGLEKFPDDPYIPAGEPRSAN